MILFLRSRPTSICLLFVTSSTPLVAYPDQIARCSAGHQPAAASSSSEKSSNLPALHSSSGLTAESKDLWTNTGIRPDRIRGTVAGWAKILWTGATCCCCLPVAVCTLDPTRCPPPTVVMWFPAMLVTDDLLQTILRNCLILIDQVCPLGK